MGEDGMSAARDFARRAVAALAICAASALLVACVTIKAPPVTSSDDLRTPAATGSAPPVEYTGPEIAPGPEAGPGLHSPAVGSSERTAVLDALRGPVEQDLGQRVVFKVLTIAVYGEWAYVRATPLAPDGSSIDYSKTAFREQVESGAFDDAVDALVKNTGGEWRTLDHVIGATDVAWSPWPEEYGAPEAIFSAQ